MNHATFAGRLGPRKSAHPGVTRSLCPILVLWLLAAAVLPIPARAEDDAASTGTAADRARHHYENGTIQYNLGRFQGAIEEYRKAYELKSDPVYLFNMAQAYHQLGAKEQALHFYERYLATQPDAPNRAQVTDRIEELRLALPATLASPSQPPAATQASALPSVPVPALDARASQTRAQAVDAGPSRSVWRRWWFWSGAGALVVVAGAIVALIVAGNGHTVPTTDLGTQRFF